MTPTPTNPNAPTVYLVDTSSLIFRAFYAIPNLTAPDGQPVNALYGFITMVIRLINDRKPSQLIFCYDSKTPGARYQIYPEYKANRGTMPDELASQIPLIKNIIDYLGLPSIEIEGVEADDIIGTLVAQANGQGWNSVIVSSDKDFAQLIGPTVSMYDTMKEVTIDPEGAYKKWQVKPEQMIDYLALVGDSSDNIPGVTGVGPKTASKLLEEHGSLDGVYQNIEQIKGALKERLKENKQMAYLSQKLVTIDLHLKLKHSIQDIPTPTQKPELVYELFDKFNFKTLKPQITKLLQGPAPTGSEDTAGPDSVQTTYSFSSTLFNEAQLTQHIQSGQTYWLFEFSEKIYVGTSQHLCQLPSTLSSSFLRSVSLNPVNGFQVKNLLHKLNIPSCKVAWDSAIASYILKAGQSLELDSLLQSYLPEYTLNPGADGYFDGLLKLETFLKQEIKPFEKLYYEIELPVTEILYQMEKEGILLDTDWLIEERTQLFNEISALEKKIHQLSGQEFNIASPKQLSQVLFETLKLPPKKKTKTGFSTDNEVLLELKDEHPVITQILEYRELTKLKSTYVDPLPQMADASGRIHTTFQQLTTATGRLSSVHPNLQNIPIRTERGERIRKAFIAKPGCLLAAFDYSQIELRVLAHACQDPGLIKAFEQNLDIHSSTASELFEVPLEKVTGDHRRTAKAVNFGIAYGQSAFGLAQTLGVNRKEAQDIIDRYFTRFPKVKDYVAETIALAKKQGFVETLFGRRRYIPEIQSKNNAVQKFGERAAINAPMQGSAADIVKLAMIQVSRSTTLKILLQVHDELVIEGPEEQLRAEAPKIQSLMQEVTQLKVPLVVHYGIGKNWSDAHG